MNEPLAELGRVISNTKISENTWDMIVEAPTIARVSQAGQFVHVRVGSSFNPFLRRPLSVGPCDNQNLRLIFNSVGVGTRIMTSRTAGDPIDLIGPLGRSFPDLPENSTPVFVAGGIGIVPLLHLDYQLPDHIERMFILGVRSENFLSMTLNEIMSRKVKVASDDGSFGYNGNVVQLLANEVQEQSLKNLIVYGCGPGPMMKALKDYCHAMDFPLYVSLEVSMGCGLGACQSCAVPRADQNGYLLVCKDGPVFKAEEVDLSPEMLP